jgi:hypothetical protein
MVLWVAESSGSHTRFVRDDSRRAMIAELFR